MIGNTAMAVQFTHIPVLAEAVLEMARQVAAPRLLVDCTVGGAGHSRLLLEAFPNAQFLGLDRDPTAVQVGRERLAAFGPRARIEQARFSELPQLLQSLQLPPADVVLADFGVSSHQLDTASRGFSFREKGSLDMRMNPNAGRAAWEILQTISENDLTAVIRELGEERHARRVARALVNDKPRTTEDLAGILRRVVPKSLDGIDPATRTFQALRMLVNEELDEISAWVRSTPDVLADGGVGIAISFHSLEDRAVKVGWRRAAKGCVCPPNLPMCACGKLPTLKLITTKVRLPDAAEIAQNPRARSARLRAAARRVRPQ